MVEEQRLADVPGGFCGSLLALAGFVVGEDHGTTTGGVLDVLDANGDASFDDLFHGEGVDDFGAVVSEFGGFFGGDDGDELSGRDFAGVGGEDSVDFFPDLEFVGVDTDGEEGGAEVGVAAADGGEEGARDDTKVAGYDGYAVFAF